MSRSESGTLGDTEMGFPEAIEAYRKLLQHDEDDKQRATDAMGLAEVQIAEYQQGHSGARSRMEPLWGGADGGSIGTKRGSRHFLAESHHFESLELGIS